jgi:hypothetical protein
VITHARVVASGTTIDQSADFWPCDATSGGFTITLPVATPGMFYVLKKVDSTGNAVTISGHGAETIDGSGTTSLSTQNAIVMLQANAKANVTAGESNWLVVASGGAGGGPIGAAGGDLGGSYPNPTVTSVAHVTAGILSVLDGGTGIAAVATGDLVYASGTNVIARLADVATGQVLVSGGVGLAPSYSATPTVTSLTATTLTGTLATAAQTNVTSVGTLAGLTMTGTLAMSSTPVISGSPACTLGATTVTTLGTAGTITLTDGNAINVGTSSGTIIGQSTSAKLGFFGAAAVAQISGSTDVLSGLVTLGFRAASSNPPLNLGSGSITCGTIANSGAITNSTGASNTTTTTIHTVQNDNGGAVAWGVLRSSITTNSNAVSLGSAVPANSYVYAVSGRVTTVINTGTWGIADQGSTHVYFSGLSASANTTIAGGPNGTQTSYFTSFYTSANTFVVTNSGSPASGVVEVEIYYYTVTPPTS